MRDHFVIAHINTLDLFKNDNLLFNSRKKAKEYLKNHLSDNLHCYWLITSVKEYNKYCENFGMRYKQINVEGVKL